MYCLRKAKLVPHFILLVATLVWGGGAAAIPVATVDFTTTPGGATGQFSFDFPDGAAEFGRPTCLTCDLTAFDFTDPTGHVWSSTGVGNGGVNAFSVAFGTTGNIASWSFSLGRYDVPCTVAKTGCRASRYTTLNSTEFYALTVQAWPQLTKCVPDAADPTHCTLTVVQQRGEAESSTPRLRVSYTAQVTVPEPSSLALLGLGLGILPRMRRRLARRALGN